MPATIKHDKHKPASHPHRDLYQEVTDTIIQQLEKGSIPWLKPWNSDNQFSFGLPINLATGNGYRGINIVLLWASAQKNGFTSNEWASFRQWQSKNQHVRKGEKGTMIVYYDTLDREDEKGELRKIPFLKQSVVFNRTQLADYQSEGPVDTVPAVNLVERIDSVERFVHNTKATIEQPFHRACYSRLTDRISMPDRAAFIDTIQCTATEGYYATLLHELTHWTGHPSRLDRTFGKRFGDRQYAVEELVAELGAAFTTTKFGISRPEKENHTAYIGHWLQVLRENKYAVIAAASEASKASDYLHGLQPERMASN